MGSKIVDIEYYLPVEVLDNVKLQAEFPDWDAEQFEKKIGIKERHIAGENETALDLAEQAAKKIFKRYDKKKIDFLLFCTQTPDYILPTSACILQNRLGLRRGIGALDFNLGCSGYIYGLALCKGLIASKIAKNILLVTAETYSRHIHPRDRGNKAIFGDAAAVTIVESAEEDHIMDFVLGTDGSGFENLIVKNGAGRNPYNFNAEFVEDPPGSFGAGNNLYMNGPEIFNFTIKFIPGLVSEILEKNNLEIEEIDQVIFHQANKYILEYLRKKMNIDNKQFYIDMRYSGNTVSATIPIALKQCIEASRLSTGNKALLVGFGVGYSWGGTVVAL
jgi:3-oxoacyl-[acyl-carrier-protein] synthase III